ncbi:hypothetical protein [Actinomadura sp. 3N508]|uniref:hypothetical protein n=1 Tax=Actinomadura sp. 3N508 TaxID=3375153 RepID=UPI0037A16970
MSIAGDRSELRSDLAWAASRLLRNCYRQAEDNDELKHPTLARVIQKVMGADSWRASSNQALIDALRQAIDKLPEEMTGRGPESEPGTVGNSSWRGQPERHFAEILYGFRDGEIRQRFEKRGLHVTQPTYDEHYHSTVLELAGFDPNSDDSTAKRMLRVIREDLADELLKMEQKASRQPLPTSRSAKVGAWHEYVPRPELQAQFREAWDSEAKVIILVGLPGMGKTWLARQLTASSAGESAPRILITSGKPHEPDIQAALLAQQIEIRGPVISDPRAHLALLLSHEDAPHLVVLDNLDSTDELRQLLPNTFRSRLVATSRRRGDTPPEDCEFISVGAMSDEEAAALIALRLPTLSEEDTRSLAEALGNYPLALTHACTLIAKRDLSVAQFTQDLRWDAAGITQRISTQHDADLLTVLQRLVQLLEAEDPKAHALIRYMAFVSIVPVISSDFLRRCLNAEMPTTSYTSFLQALETLESYCLIDHRAVKGFIGESPTIAIHPLTQVMLRQVFRADWKATAQGFGKVFDAYVVERKAYKRRGEESPPEFQQWESLNTMLVYAFRCVERWHLYLELEPTLGSGRDGAGRYVDDYLEDMEFLHDARDSLVERGLLPEAWRDWLWERLIQLIEDFRSV